MKSYNDCYSQSVNHNKSAVGTVLVYLFMKILERCVQPENAFLFPESPAQVLKILKIPMQSVNTLSTDIFVHTDEPKVYTRAFAENLT